MSVRSIRASLYAALGVAFLLRHDFWQWNSSNALLGLPVGLTYHVLFCLVVSVLMALLVRLAWHSAKP